MIQSKADVGPDKPTLTKRARTKDRRDIGSFPSTSVLKRSKKEVIFQKVVLILILKNNIWFFPVFDNLFMKNLSEFF